MHAAPEAGPAKCQEYPSPISSSTWLDGRPLADGLGYAERRERPSSSNCGARTGKPDNSSVRRAVLEATGLAAMGGVVARA